MSSDTPKTDSEVMQDEDGFQYVEAKFARQLERENAMLLEALKACVTLLLDEFPSVDVSAKDYWPTVKPVIQQARAAIAAVEGK